MESSKPILTANLTIWMTASVPFRPPVRWLNKALTHLLLAVLIRANDKLCSASAKAQMPLVILTWAQLTWTIWIHLAYFAQILQLVVIPKTEINQTSFKSKKPKSLRPPLTRPHNRLSANQLWGRAMQFFVEATAQRQLRQWTPTHEWRVNRTQKNRVLCSTE